MGLRLIRDKVILAFGGGRESCDLVEKYKGYNPLLVTIIGEEDDVDPRLIQGYAESKNLRYKIIRNKKGFVEDLIIDDYQKKIDEPTYTNTVLQHIQLKEDEILIVGRTMRDIQERANVKFHIKKPTFKNIKFPLWTK